MLCGQFILQAFLAVLRGVFSANMLARAFLRPIRQFISGIQKENEVREKGTPGIGAGYMFLYVVLHERSSI